MDVTDTELQLLTRHLAGVTTAEEEARLREWMAADPNRPHMLSSLRDAWDLSSTLPRRTYDLDSAWMRILDCIRFPDARHTRGAAMTDAYPTRQCGASRRESGFGRGAWRAAAVALLVAGSGLIWRSLVTVQATKESAALEIVLPRGQEARLRLPDGSRVVLAPESKLRYPRSFGDHSRELHLEGMGYFEVVHDPARPFVVHAGAGVARVLGTRFVVRAYPGAPRVEVAVAQGSVSLGADPGPPDRAVALTPGQVGRLDPDGVARLEHGSTAKGFLGWMDGQPVIHDLALSDALVEIERWFDVNLAVDDPRLASRRITTTMERSSLRETLAAIALALNARYVTRGDTLVFLRNH